MSGTVSLKSERLGPGTFGDLQRGGVLQDSTKSSDVTWDGTSSPTRIRSNDPSSIPRPSQRPQGNLARISFEG